MQRARVAEISGDQVRAVGLWDAARAARAREVEGWDGALRLRVALGRAGEAVKLVRGCPAPVLRVVGPRLAATLLLCRDPARARAVLARLPEKLPAVRALAVALLTQTAEPRGRQIRGRLAARGSTRRGRGASRCSTCCRPVQTRTSRPRPPATVEVLAGIAARRGAAVARAALAAALATDPAWAPVLAGPPPEPHGWTGAAHDLAGVGLEREAAALYPHTFPEGSPSELAWSARTLAAWGNRPAALTAGERLWGRLGPVPAVLLPETLLPAILPPELVAACVAAAQEQGVPASWLVGIIRQESRFDVDAFSDRRRGRCGAVRAGGGTAPGRHPR